MRRTLSATTAIGLLLALASGPAIAEVTGGCDGQAVIEGVTYTPANDSASNPIVVPDADGVMIPWQGSAPFGNNGHEGELRLHLGPTTIRIADWADDDLSAPNESRADGVYALDDFREELPFPVVGLYRVSGTHAADGGSCSGSVMLRFEGATLGSPVAAGATGLGALGVVLVVLAAVVTHAAATAGRVRGRQLLGLVGGLIVGVAVAILLQQTAVWPLDTLSSIGLPVLAAVLGLLAGRLAPFGRGRLATATAPPGGGGPVTDPTAVPGPGTVDGSELVRARRISDLVDDEWSGRLAVDDANELRDLKSGDDWDAWRRVLDRAEAKPAAERTELERRIAEQARHIREQLKRPGSDRRLGMQEAARRLGDLLGGDAPTPPSEAPAADPPEPPDDDDFDPDDLSPIVPLA